MPMQTSQKGIDLIKRFEGLETEAYQDIAGVWTIGYGHSERSEVFNFEIHDGVTITEDQAEDILKRDLRTYETIVTALVQKPINQHQFDALVSLSYNIGVTALKTSTALKRLNMGDYEGAADAITWFNKSTIDGVLTPVRGLTRRRAAEKLLFLEPIKGESSNSPNADGFDIDEVSNVQPVEMIRIGLIDMLLKWLNII